MRDALLGWLEQHDLLPESQFGFRPGRSVAMALACAQSDWTRAKSNGDFMGIMTFDLSSAFDTVSAKTLLKKLESAGFTGRALSWMESYMTGRSCQIENIL